MIPQKFVGRNNVIVDDDDDCLAYSTGNSLV